jgi:hypothetical protein
MTTPPVLPGRGVLAGTALAGTSLLRASLSAEPDSPRFYALTLSAAGCWLVGGLRGGAPPMGGDRTTGRPVAVGAAAFGAFYAAARAARRIPALDDAITSVLRYAHGGSNRLVLVTTLLNGLGEEVFFRGAVYAASGRRHPVPVSTAAYTLAATATRNPALVAASAVMGTLFARQRRATGGIRAPVLTHLTWSALMLRFMPPLFRR